MAIIALGRLDKKLLLNVFLFIVQTVNIIIRNSVNNLSEENLKILEEEISKIRNFITFYIYKKKSKAKYNKNK